MADGNNFEKKRSDEDSVAKALMLGGELAASAMQSMEQVAGAIQSSLGDVANAMAEKVAKALDERMQKAEKHNEVDVETTDKILNGAMNNSRFDVKVSLAEGILNGLFCGSLITVNIHNYAASPQPENSDVSKTEES